MTGEVSHDRQDESPEAKVSWFRSLTVQQRMQMLCEITDLALELNPSLQDARDDGPPCGRVQTISRA